MRYNLVKLRSTVTLLLAVLYLSHVFIGWQFLGITIKVFLVTVLILSIFEVRGSSRIIGYFLFIVGSGLLLYYDASLSVWVEALSRNLYLVVMFTFVPLLGIPIRRGGYAESLESFFRQYTRQDNHFYLLVKLATLLVAVMVNVAAVPLMYQISLASEKSRHKRLLGTAITRGIVTSLIWAPSYAGVALAIELTGADWLDFFPYGFLIGAVAVLIGWIITVFEEKKQNCHLELPQEISKIAWGKLIELLVFGLILISVIVFVASKTGISTIIVVAMVSLIAPVVWMALLNKIPILAEEFMGPYFIQSLPKLRNEIVLFVGAGFLSTAIGFSHLGDLLPGLFSSFVGDNGIFLSLAVMLPTIALALIGIHPIITVTVIGSSLQGASLQVSSALLALTFTCSWALGSMLSPSAAMNISVASLLGESPLDTGPKWNGAYGFILFVVITLLLYLFGGLGWV